MHTVQHLAVTLRTGLWKGLIFYWVLHSSPIRHEGFAWDEIVDDILLEMLLGIGAIVGVVLIREILSPIFQQHLLC